ncbi:hypothetical protein QE152_g25984 [Popillia japonica]|uniref:DDE-1 domain-containing protein n=1 Tax=Popillia japonica TaxID=7064 RepID=A0AAW1K059_POPJA
MKLLFTVIEIEEGQEMIEKLKRINVKDAAYWVARAWAGVRASTIVNSWKKLLGDDEGMETESTDEIEETILPLMQRIPGCDDASLQD